MTKRGVLAIFLTCYVNICFFTHLASGSFPNAQNVTWSSLNFKTLLKWGPSPSADYSYTVEYNEVGQNTGRNPNCIRITETLCDLSNSLSNLRATYTADVLSMPPLGAKSDIIEFPYTSSERFCPFKDTNISKPEFKLEVGKDKRTITLYVKDPLTALFDGTRQLSIRDIFIDELHYMVTYKKAGSSGEKHYISKTSEIVLKDLDRGEGYCFNVQAYIPTRSRNKQLGQLSDIQCSHDDNQSIFDVYPLGVIAGGIFLILAIVAIIIAVIVVCCKRRRKAQKSGKEGVPLRDV